MKVNDKLDYRDSVNVIIENPQSTSVQITLYNSSYCLFILYLLYNSVHL